MPIQAVIVDVYRTVMAVHPIALSDREDDWRILHKRYFDRSPIVSLAALDQECRRHVDREHRAAGGVGIRYPEVCWEAVMAAALPDLTGLPEPARRDFVFEHIQLYRRLEWMPGAATVLRRLREGGVPLGIGSNAQPYTLRELDALLKREGMDWMLFEPDLRAWSFENGFSKPDPHVFRTLVARLRLRGISPEAALMVGDRVDNDMAPARAQGFQTWHLDEQSEPSESWEGGNWAALERWLELQGVL